LSNQTKSGNGLDLRGRFFESSNDAPNIKTRYELDKLMQEREAPLKPTLAPSPGITKITVQERLTIVRTEQRITRLKNSLTKESVKMRHEQRLAKLKGHTKVRFSRSVDIEHER